MKNNLSVMECRYLSLFLSIFQNISNVLIVTIICNVYLNYLLLFKCYCLKFSAMIYEIQRFIFEFEVSRGYHPTNQKKVHLLNFFIYRYPFNIYYLFDNKYSDDWEGASAKLRLTR